LDVKKDCGCTVPTYDSVIPPGKTGHLRVTLRMAGLLGAVEKHVYMETDDPKLASVAFTIKAVLPRAIEILPDGERLIPGPRGAEATTQVRLRSTDGNDLDIGTIESGAPYLSAEVEPGTPHQGREVTLRIHVAADAPAQTFETMLMVNTGHLRVSRVGIRIF